MSTKQRCPKCNYLNLPEATRCANCRASFLQVCPQCGTARPWYVEHCPHCEGQSTEDTSAFTSLFRQAPNQRLHGRYVIKDTLSSGRVSAVYRAVDIQSPSLVYAIKELSTVALFRPDERREAEAALHHAVGCWAKLVHPALPRLVETFSEHDSHYVVSEYVEGWSLKRIIEERRVRVTPELARNWGGQLCQLLGFLHTQTPPLFVSFLAPGHVLVNTRGEVSLVDWGLTALFAPGSYGPYGSLRGYAAPELQDGPSALTDVFAVGRLLYALLTGQLLEKGLARQLPLNQAVPGISGQLVKAVAQAAHRDPVRRYTSIADLQTALWDPVSGPLAPLTDWLEQAQLPVWEDSTPVSRAAPRPAAREMARPQSAGGESMADLGFVRDPRFTQAGPGATVPELRTDQPPQSPAKLSVTPHQFNLSDLSSTNEVTRVVLVLRNAGEAELVGRVTSHLSWLSAPDKAVRLPAGKQAKVILTVRTALVPSGRTVEPQALSVDTNGGRQWVGITAEIVTGPSLCVEQPILDFGTLSSDAERALPLPLSNKGRQRLSGKVLSRVPWLRVPQSDFRCPPGAATRVQISVLPERLPRSAQRVQGALLVDSDGGQEQVEVHVWHPMPELDLGATHMDLGAIVGGELAERYLIVGNTGDGPLQGAVRSLVPWLQVFPQQFTCAPGEFTQLTLAADSVGLSDGTQDIPQALRLQTNAGTRTLALRLQVRAPRLVLGTTRLEYGTVPLGEARERRLVLRNEGSAPFVATIQSMAEWLTLSQSQVVGEPGAEISVTVRAETGRFAHGQDVALPVALRVVEGERLTEIPASIIVLQPSLRAEPSELDFGYIERAQPEMRTLVITNDGTGRLAWNVQTDAQWIEVRPAAGVCEAGASIVLTLTAYGLALESGVLTSNATLIVNSDGGRAKIPLRVALAAPLLVNDSAFLDLGTSLNMQPVSGAFMILNRGLGTLRGSISADQTWLVVERASFECGMGRAVEVRVSTDMDEFPHGVTLGRGSIRIESNGGHSQIEVAVGIVLAPRLVVSEEAVLVSTSEDQPLQGRIIIKNTGQATARAEMRSSVPQIVLSRDLCDIKPDKSVRIALHWEGPPFALPDELFVTVVSENERLRVPVRLKREGRLLA